MPTHRPLAELAARHRVPIIVQKPFAPTFEDCVAIVEAARTAEVPLMVHENFRFQTPIMKAHDALVSGEIGRPLWGRFTFRTGYDVYANQPYLARERQLIILDLGIHLLDVARVFMGEVLHVYCEAQTIRAEIAGDDMATIMMRHVSGAVSVVDCTYESRQVPDPFPQTLVHIDGSKGTLRLKEDFVMEVQSGGRVRREDVGSPLLSWTSSPWHVAQESVLNTQAHWIDCLATGKEPSTSGSDNLKTYALVAAAYASARSHKAESPADAD
jgi:predicted dehydrogenase